MAMEALRWLVCRRPGAVVAAWLALALAVVLAAPNLTELAAEGQAHLLPWNSESGVAAQMVRTAWPDQMYQSVAVLVLQRPGGLTSRDHDYAQAMGRWLVAPGRPDEVLRVLGPESRPEIAQALVSQDDTVQLLIVHISESFVGPTTEEAVAWLEEQTAIRFPPPEGLDVRWTGDAVFGRDYMDDVQRSLDRAAVVTVFLLLIVLLLVYRSLLLALVPLVTIGIGLAISRGVLAWLTAAGWEISPLVELFLIVILFGCGTDFCLFLSWRFGENWRASDPGGAMGLTLSRTVGPLLTSAGTVIAGLSLMGLTEFKLFSTTGPSVALGLAITLTATLTLTPALLVLLARHRPRSFAGLTAPSSGFWNVVGHRVLARPILTWLATVLVMGVPAVLSAGTTILQDTVAELPQGTPSVRTLDIIARKFGAGRIAPLTVVIRAEEDLRSSEGLAMIDDISRLLGHQRSLVEVRSATQPLGSTEPLERARLASRLGEVNQGFDQMIAGAQQLQEGLNEGAAKLRTAIMLEELTGVPLTGTPAGPSEPSTRDALVSGLKQATGALLGAGRATSAPEPEPTTPKAGPRTPEEAEGPRAQMLRELTLAANGAGQIVDGADRARHEVSMILSDPVGRHALDRLLITPETVRDNPELLESFETYIARDGHLTRIDLVQAARMFSPGALQQVEDIRRQLREYLREEEFGGVHPRVLVTGPNAAAADIQEVTRRDQILSWIVVPLGVFFILFLALRDVLACLNLVVTMVLTYAFALGITHAVFVWGLGAEGIDWKVPYFLFVLLVAVGVDYNVFLMTRLQEEARALGLRAGIVRAIAQTGGLISSAAAITACSFASFLSSPLSSLRQLGFALVVGITIDAVLVRPVLVPCGHWLLNRRNARKREQVVAVPQVGALSRVPD